MAKGTGDASKDAIKGMFEYAKDNKRKFAGKVAGATFGMATAGMMLGGADFGDFSKAVAGYNIGSGFAEGYMKNSAKELQSQSDAAAKMVSNLTGEKDMQNLFATAQQEGANDIKKNLNNAIGKIREILAGNKDKDRIVNKFTRWANGKDAGQITKESISQMLTDQGITGTTNLMATDAFENYGKLIGYQSIANNIQQASGMGIDRESLAKIVDNKVETVETEETVTTKVNIDEIADKVASKISGANVNSGEIKEEFSNLSTYEKNQVVHKVSLKHEEIKSLDDVINKLDS